ncbi:hypothetical protein SAMN05444172_9042 [Burkholderia sp. GAS332]|nr:hypothetical protein SAMN05444172_9042 [Burkholderia sp. GAS332]
MNSIVRKLALSAIPVLAISAGHAMAAEPVQPAIVMQPADKSELASDNAKSSSDNSSVTADEPAK